MTTRTSAPDAKNDKLARASEATANGENEFGDYQIRPSLNQSFQVGKVKEIIVDVFQQVLDGTYARSTFTLQIYFESARIVYSHFHLSGKEYTKTDAATWSRQIVNEINSRIVDLKMQRYAHVVQITMMEQTGAGSRSISRCLWDASCDSPVFEIYKSKTMTCIVSVYGVYRY